MGSPRTTLAPRPDATPASSRAAVARCYAYLVERRRSREQKAVAELAPTPYGREMRQTANTEEGSNVERETSLWVKHHPSWIDERKSTQ